LAAATLVAHWSRAEKYAFKVKGEIWFRRRQKRFQFRFVSPALFRKPVPSKGEPEFSGHRAHLFIAMPVLLTVLFVSRSTCSLAGRWRPERSPSSERSGME
jgi:hypothetical protein